jgi:hypothetical protein
VTRYIAVRKLPILPKATDLINRQGRQYRNRKAMSAHIDGRIDEIRALKRFVAC